MKRHRVAILALDAVLPLDLGIPAQVFRPRDLTSYEVTTCALTPEVATTAGFSLRVPGTLQDLRQADTVIVPGYFPHQRDLPQEVLQTLAELHAQGRRMVSICTGAFALAAAGVLDGLSAATHWQEAGALAERYPQIRVNQDVLFVDEGNVLTSAGVSSGMDLCLHIIRRDLGAHVANMVARHVVAPPHREGGQAQFIQTPAGPEDSTSLAATRAWALERLGEPLTVTDLARHADMSPRTLARRFMSETSTTPIQWLLRARIDLARDLLETTDLTIDQVAHRTGVGTGDNLRLHFRRLVATTPTAYRRSFSATAGT